MPTSETIPYSPPTASKLAFVEHYASTVLGQGFILGLGILTGVVSARILGPAGRGEYAAIIAWPLGIATLLSLGVNQGIAFFLGKRVLTVSEVATATAIIGLIQGALSIVIGLSVVP